MPAFTRVLSALFILLGLGAVVFFGWHTPAMPQELDPDGTRLEGADPSDGTVERIAANIRRAGLDVAVSYDGDAEEIESDLKSISSGGFVILPYQGRMAVFDYEELVAGGFIGDDVDALVEASNRRGLAAGDRIYRFTIGDKTARLAVSKTDLSPVGSLFAYSRLFGETFLSARSDPLCCVEEITKRNCKVDVLSFNLLGNPAEQIRSCTEAVCSSSRFLRSQQRSIEYLKRSTRSAQEGDFEVKSCELESVNQTAWGFGYVEFEPSELPQVLVADGARCKASIRYEWGVRFGSVKLGDALGEFSLPDIGSNKGNLINEISCRKSER